MMGSPTIHQYLFQKFPSLALIPLLFSFLLYHFAAPIAGDSPPLYYDAVDNITLDCGSPKERQAEDQRLWLADTNTSKLITLLDNPTPNSSKTSSASQPSTSKGPVPYSTARLSLSPFTYLFSITPGQIFVRLHFYPTNSYNGFENYTPFFSVMADNFILLNNFSASINTIGSDTLMKEFCISVPEGQRLVNLTFIPSSAVHNAYAFINGIEIVSMPTNLYYTDTYADPMQIIGTGGDYSIDNNTALELMYRINVGGNGIPQASDTGMYRNWDLDSYLSDTFRSAIPVNQELNLTFSEIKNYTAPADVYRTATSMGPNATVNEHSNLTWIFPVDSGFTYLVRLHFCELMPFLNTYGLRVFYIYLATQLAEKDADIVGWTGGHGIGIPVYRDYAVAMGNSDRSKETMKRDLLIQLHPFEIERANYTDAILNGVEIFKTSNILDLAGIHLYSPSTTISSPNTPPFANNHSKFAVIGGVLAGIVVLVFLTFLIVRRRQKLNKGKDAATSSDGWTSWWDPLASLTTTNKSTKSQNASLPTELCRYFSLSEIKAATNNFDEVFIIGVGGFGEVYKGFIGSLSAEVAIKRLKQGSEQGATEFKTEIEMLSQLRHLHLVSLIGYCNEDSEMILVYDYMSRGTLRDHLYNTDNPPLSWSQRLEICIGSARGLQYLHSGAKHTIIHRDVKTTNILLDDKWVAKVSDFGLSKIGPNSATKAHISTVVKGSIGYLDPEYYRRQQLTEKSDVYSFGVVLCEVLCARPPVNRSHVKKPVSLAEWFRQSYGNGRLTEIVDPYLNGKIAPECLKKYTEVAVRCLADSGADRPSMGDVVWALEFALELQETAKEQAIRMKSSKGSYDQEGNDQAESGSVDLEAPLRFGGSSVGDDNEDLFSVSSGIAVSAIGGITSTTNSSSEEQSLLSIRSFQMLNSGAVFSEIMNSKGR